MHLIRTLSITVFAFGIFCISFSSYAFFSDAPQNQQEYDQKRIEDILHISGYIEEYYKKTGNYPVINEPQENLVSTLLTDKPPRKIKPDFSYVQLEQALKEVLGHSITLPKDPRDGDSWRFYQYATDGQNYYVSTFLYYKKPYTRNQGKHHHKVEITSKPSPNYMQYKRQDIQRFEKFGMDQNDLQTELFETLQKRDFEAAKKAINKGANPSPTCNFNHRCQPLATASEDGDLDLIEFLIGNGADPDGYNAYYDVALIYALGAQQNEAGMLLVKLGANVNLPNAFGMSPFLGVCVSADAEMVKLMIEHGANVNRNFLMQNSSASKGQKNDRPLHAAIKAGSEEVVQLLLNSGADPTLKSSKGQTMIELAQETGNAKIIKLITNQPPKP